MAGGKFSLANLFGMTIRESANDGSDFTNPDADYRRLFLGEDGQLHVKDSAGTVTAIGSGTAVTVSSNYLTGDVTMTSANTFYDGPSLSLAAGTYILNGHVAYLETGTGSYFTVRLWDGTTVISEGLGRTENAVGVTVSISGTVVLVGTTTIKISGASNAAGRAMKATIASNGTANKGSYLIAAKIA
jgi:hypothetical protein